MSSYNVIQTTLDCITMWRKRREEDMKHENKGHENDGHEDKGHENNDLKGKRT